MCNSFSFSLWFNIIAIIIIINVIIWLNCCWKMQSTYATNSHLLPHLLLDINGAREDNRDRYTDSGVGRYPLQASQRPISIIPPFLRRMPFVRNPPNLFWLGTGTGICWIAYAVTWLKNLNLSINKKPFHRESPFFSFRDVCATILVSLSSSTS